MYALTYMLCNLFRVYLIQQFITIFFQKRKVERRFIFLTCMLFWLVNSAVFLFWNIPWLNLLNNILGIFIIGFMYTNRKKYLCFATAIIIIICMVCDMVATGLFTTAYEFGENLNVLTYIVVDLLLLISLGLTRKIMQLKNDRQDMPSIVLILIPAISISILLYITYTRHYRSDDFILISMGILCINFFELYLYNMLLESMKEKYENQMLKQRVQSYAGQLKIIYESEQRVKQLRHDIKNHLSELWSLIKQNKNQEALTYIDSMSKYMRSPMLVEASGNIETDSLLNYMLSMAKQEGLHVKTELCIPDSLGDLFDFNIVLGNLLENAICAARESVGKMLYVKIYMEKGVLHMIVKNNYSGELHKEGGRFLTTKKDAVGHGLGLQSVTEVVERNHGEIQYDITDQVFTVKVMFFVADL